MNHSEPATTAGHQAVAQGVTGRAAGQIGQGWLGLLAGVGAALISFFGSWNPSLWTDEAATISAATRGQGELWQLLGNLDLVHGLYYYGMHFWVQLFGISAISIRLPSAVAIGIAGACVYWLGARLRGTTLAVLAAMIFAVLPRVFWAGAEARPYALTAMLAVAAALLLVIALDTDSRLAWIGYPVIMLLGVLSNLYVGLLFAAQLVSIYSDRGVTGRQRARWWVCAGSTTIISLPFLLVAARQSDQLGTRDFGWSDLIQNFVVQQWFLGDTPTTTTGIAKTTMSPGDIGSWWAPAALLFAAVSWVLMAYACVRQLRGAASPGRPLLPWLLPWIIVPALVIGLYSVLMTPMYSPRYLTFATPAVALLMAVGLLEIPLRWLRGAIIGLLILAAIPIYVSQRQLYGKNSSDWLSVAQFIDQHAAPGDTVYFAPRYVVPGDTVGRTTRSIETAYPDDFSGLLDLTLLRDETATDDLVGESRRLADSSAELADVTTLWVIRRNDYPADEAAADDAFLAANGFVSGSTWTGPLDIVIKYERTA